MVGEFSREPMFIHLSKLQQIVMRIIISNSNGKQVPTDFGTKMRRNRKILKQRPLFCLFLRNFQIFLQNFGATPTPGEVPEVSIGPLARKAGTYVGLSKVKGKNIKIMLSILMGGSD